MWGVIFEGGGEMIYCVDGEVGDVWFVVKLEEWCCFGYLLVVSRFGCVYCVFFEDFFFIFFLRFWVYCLVRWCNL